MNKVCIVLLATALATAGDTPMTIIWNQFLYIGNDLYNLKTFNNGGDFTINGTDEAKVPYSINFRLASITKNGCAGDKKGSAYAYGTYGANCKALTSNVSLGITNFTETADSTAKTYSLKISYPVTDDLTFYVITTCDKSAAADLVTFAYDPVNSPNTLTVLVTSKQVCPIATGIKSFWFYFSKYQLIFAIVFWVFGLFLTFLGLKLFKFIMFVIGFIATVLAIDVFFNQFVMPANAPQYAFWIMLGVSVVLGIAVGVVCCIFHRVGVFLLGSLFGAVLGLILYSAFISRFSQKTWLLGVTIGILAVACGFVAWYANTIGVIVATSLVGSYMLVRGSSWYIGGYPNEWNLATDIEQNGWKAYWKFYIYMGVMLLLMVVGIVVQYSIYKRGAEDEELEKKFQYFKFGSGNTTSKNTHY